MDTNKIPEKFKPLPLIDNSSCFGCGPSNAMGLHMKFYSDGKSVVSSLTVPEHLCGWRNVVHGGIVCTILDEIMSWTTIYLLKKLVLTKRMTVNFLKPTLVNQPLFVEGWVAERPDERHALIKAAIHTPDDEISANSEGVFTLFSFDDAVSHGFLEPSLSNEMLTKFLHDKP